MEEKIKCCLCGKTIDKNKSHNASPLTEGRCCLGCNTYRVVPYRIFLAKQEENQKHIDLIRAIESGIESLD